MSRKITSYFKRVPTASAVTTQKSARSTEDNKYTKDKVGNENEMNTINQDPQFASKRKRVESGDCGGGDLKRMSENKSKAKLIKISKELKIISPTIGPSWYEALEVEFSKPYFSELSRFITEERGRATVFPSHDEVWSWTTRACIHDVRVVILGQDPYHGPGQAHGLCFSVKPGVSPPPSLVNMYKELANDIPGFSHPGHGHLVGWADQGVLLLNAVLTVRSGNANSHKDRGWEKLTDAVIRWISDNSSGVVFLLWGAYAQKKAACVDRRKHHLLSAVHPSPLSAHRGFLGCKHFSKCNDLLRADGKQPIHWNILPL